MKVLITKEYLNDLFIYKEGKLFWKRSPARRIKVGTEACSLSGNGYLRVAIKQIHYPLHRIIFMMHHGYLPKYVDHIDGNPLNNCIDNLREATQTQNLYNAKKRKDNSSGLKGISWVKRLNKWLVQLSINKKNTYLGVYEDLELAELVAQEARILYHGRFARTL